MQYEALVRTVARRAGIPEHSIARLATDTALRLLSARLPEPVLRRLTRQLDPRVAARLMPRPGQPEPAGDDYVAELAEHSGLDAVRAARVGRCVLQALEVDSAGELRRVPQSQLPEDVRDLLRRRFPSRVGRAA